jgi:hypothetical protein
MISLKTLAKMISEFSQATANWPLPSIKNLEDAVINLFKTLDKYGITPEFLGAVFLGVLITHLYYSVIFQKHVENVSESSYEEDSEEDSEDSEGSEEDSEETKDRILQKILGIEDVDPSEYVNVTEIEFCNEGIALSINEVSNDYKKITEKVQPVTNYCALVFDSKKSTDNNKMKWKPEITEDITEESSNDESDESEEESSDNVVMSFALASVQETPNEAQGHFSIGSDRYPTRVPRLYGRHFETAEEFLADLTKSEQ